MGQFFRDHCIKIDDQRLHSLWYPESLLFIPTLKGIPKELITRANPIQLKVTSPEAILSNSSNNQSYPSHRQVIQMARPDVILVELCQSRINILKMDEARILEEAKNLNLGHLRQLIQRVGSTWDMERLVNHIFRKFGQKSKNK